MEQPVLPPSPDVSPVSTSLGARLTNIFVAPSAVYDEVKASPPNHANWLVPGVLASIIGIIACWVIFSQPMVLQSITEQKHKAMEKQLAHLSPAERDRVMATADMFSGPTFLKLTGSVQAVFGAFAIIAVAALFIWGLGKLIFQAEFTYLKSLEVCGLAAMIGVLGKIIGTLLILITGTVMTTLSPALLLSPFDATNFSHLLLSNLNFISLWYLAVLSIGLARLSGVPTLKSAIWVFGCWLLFRLGLVTIGWGAQRMLSAFQSA